MKTIAFVLGNNDYFEGAQLKCAVNDAAEMAAIFRRLGYDVFEKLNFKSEECSNILSSFEDGIKDYDASIFYFAGHGFELEGENYLIPIDCQIPPINKHEANRYCIRLTEVLGILKTNSGKVNIVIIDACRKTFDRGVASSFAQVQAPKGTLIAFSTSPNEGAKDGNGQDGHSVYTSALLLRPEKRKVQSSKTKSTELTSQNNKTKSTKEGRKISTPPFLHHIEDTIDMIN